MESQPPTRDRQAQRPLRMLTLTTLFPSVAQPRHGIFVANRLQRICATGRLDAEVVAAVPWFPGWYRHDDVPYRESIAGVAVHHPRYLNIPAVGMRLAPALLASAILSDLRKRGIGRDCYDVVDAHYFYPDGVAAARVAAALDLPLVISARGSDINLIGGIGFARRAMLQAARYSSAIVAVSDALRVAMIELGMPAARITVLRNGVDATMFVPVPRGEARRSLGLADDVHWVAAVGNLVPEKGLDLLIRALATLHDTRLLIVGEGQEKRRLRALAAQFMAGRVEFRHNMPQTLLRDVYSAADVLALPSHREGWPNVLLEAMACGTPVVAARVGGVPEIVEGALGAQLIEKRDPAAWAEALAAATHERVDSASIREHAMRFDWHEVVTRQCALYETVAQSFVRSSQRTSSATLYSHA